MKTEGCSFNADYIGPEDRANYRMEPVQEMPFDPVPQKSGLYEAGFTGSLQRNPKVIKDRKH